MIGTYLNVATVTAGSLVGRAIGDRLPARVRETVMHGVALVTVALGVQMFLKTHNPLVLLGSLVIGGALGEWLGIEQGLERLGGLLRARLARPGVEAREDDRFVEGFVTASILFCVGPVTLLGCLNDGISGNYELLAVKATMDGVSSIALASGLGWGVLCSAVTVLVFQGALTLGARWLEPLVRAPAIQDEVFAAGGAMMVALALCLLGVVKIRIGSFLPALPLAGLIAWLTQNVRVGN